MASHLDRTGEYPWDIVKKAWRLGLMNYHIPAAVGGLGADTVTGSMIAEEMAYGCCGIQLAMKVSEVAVSLGVFSRLLRTLSNVSLYIYVI